MNDIPRSTISAARILVVDDEEVLREFLVSILRAGGFECREAEDGLEALQLLRAGEKFDLMMTDIMMKGLDGVGLLERTKFEFPEMPVVMGSPVHDVSVILTCLRKGAYDYLPYPFEGKEVLLDMIRRALEDQRLKQAHLAYVADLEAQVAKLTNRTSHS